MSTLSLNQIMASPAQSTTSPVQSPTVTAVETATVLEFHTLSIADKDRLLPMLRLSTSRTCDFTVGGLFMWVDYFRYSAAVVDDTLFVMGVTENDVHNTAFSLPIGSMPMSKAIDLLKDFCEAHNIPLVLSAVPEDHIDELIALGAKSVEPLIDWGDYLYDAQSLATFSGKHLNKKRNHLNRFKADHPDYTFEPIGPENIDAVRQFFAEQHLSADKSMSADYERLQVLDVLNHPDAYGFQGAVISTPDNGVVAFTMGEVIGDTLYTHIEKMNHEVTGAGETICHDFVVMMMRMYPQLRYVNREEDTGDMGLRQAKLAYNPCQVIKKFNVRF